MKIDSLGCVVMQKDGMPGDLGDSCAETGRLVILVGRPVAQVSLDAFLTTTGFVRHPNAPDGWRESDFTADQGKYLLMAALGTDQELANEIILKLHTNPTWKLFTIEMLCLRFGLYQLFAIAQVAQVLINKIPFRWSDDHSRTGFWKFWRFTSSDTSTVSYMTTFVSMVFLWRAGVRWPWGLFDDNLYLAKSEGYYATQPNSLWFTANFYNALLEIQGKVKP